MRARGAGLTLYWAFGGALMGLGVITIFSIGLALVAFSILFLSYGLAQLEHHSLWAALVGFGVAPSGLLFYSYYSSDSFTDPMAVKNFLTALVPFALIGTAGVLWGLTDYVQSRKKLR